MPGVDLQSYLLSASPPGFDIHYTIRSSLHGLRSNEVKKKSPGPRIVTAQCNNKAASFNESVGKPRNDPLGCFESAGVDSIFEIDDLNDFDANRSRLDCHHKSKTPNVSPNKGSGKKRVCFADDLGHQLEYIRILNERPESPPFFHSDFLSSLTGGTKALCLSEEPPLRLNFSQPASDYICFRKKLESSHVSLENVILKDYKLVGTIKVKNIAFEKSVTVRYSCDKWDSFNDCEATFVDTNNVSAGQFDTFSFELSVSPKLESDQSLEFAIMYSVNDTQYWDNNNGQNYEVVPSSWKQDKLDGGDSKQTKDPNDVFGLHSPPASWAHFSAWGSRDSSIPYW